MFQKNFDWYRGRRNSARSLQFSPRLTKDLNVIQIYLLSSLFVYLRVVVLLNVSTVAANNNISLFKVSMFVITFSLEEIWLRHPHESDKAFRCVKFIVDYHRQFYKFSTIFITYAHTWTKIALLSTCRHLEMAFVLDKFPINYRRFLRAEWETG